MGIDAPLACTPRGIQLLLERNEIPISGKHVVFVGRGPTIGRPLANLFALKRPNADAAVAVVHTGVKDLGVYTRQADVVLAAAGVPSEVQAEMVKPGAALVAASVSFQGKQLMSDVADVVAEVRGCLSPRKLIVASRKVKQPHFGQQERGLLVFFRASCDAGEKRFSS